MTVSHAYEFVSFDEYSLASIRNVDLFACTSTTYLNTSMEEVGVSYTNPYGTIPWIDHILGIDLHKNQYASNGIIQVVFNSSLLNVPGSESITVPNIYDVVFCKSLRYFDNERRSITLVHND